MFKTPISPISCMTPTIWRIRKIRIKTMILHYVVILHPKDAFYFNLNTSNVDDVDCSINMWFLWFIHTESNSCSKFFFFRRKFHSPVREWSENLFWKYGWDIGEVDCCANAVIRCTLHSFWLIDDLRNTPSLHV